jgi:hypothetical protein
MNAQTYQRQNALDDQAIICRQERQLEAVRDRLDTLEAELPPMSDLQPTTEWEAGYVEGQKAIIAIVREALCEGNLPKGVGGTVSPAKPRDNYLPPGALEK